MKRKALYAGSFDPFTRGHADIVARGLDLFDEVIVAIGTNDAKRNLFTAQERLQQIQRYYIEEPRVRVLTYTGLTVSLAQELKVKVLLRGVRAYAGRPQPPYRRYGDGTPTCLAAVHPHQLDCGA